MNAVHHNYKTILITGASSGIGEALALALAGRGVFLVLTGRDQARLDDVVARCRDLGADVIADVVDVADRAAMQDFIVDIDAQRPIDLVIANAGISAGTGGVLVGENAEQVYRVFDVNLYGVLNTIEPLRAAMAERRHGQIAIISSLAGYRGWPGAPAYCASKAAVRVYGEALRGAMAGVNVGVSVVCPGFVVSRITAVNEFPMPFLMKTEKAAKIIVRGLKANRAIIAFPLAPFMVVKLLTLLPDGLAQRILRRMPSKEAKM